MYQVMLSKALFEIGTVFDQSVYQVSDNLIIKTQS